MRKVVVTMFLSLDGVMEELPGPLHTGTTKSQSSSWTN